MLRNATLGFLALAAVGALAGCETTPAPGPTKIFIASDSTAANYGPSRYPEFGWGMVLKCSLDPSVSVVNLARGGRSTKTFISEGLWDQLIAQVSPGDTVLIQFGHNDASQNRPERYTEPKVAYPANLKRFVAEVRAKGAQPVLITPVTQRRFRDGKVVSTHGAYSPAVRAVARQTRTPLIDLDADSQAYFTRVGEEASKRYFMIYAPGELPSLPQGKTDNTHLNERGARAVAGLVATRLKALHIPLARRVSPAVTSGEPALRGGPECP